jgi:hypothetical protein
MSDSKDETLGKVAEACKPGDIIAIPPGGNYGSLATARLCDFSKAIPIVSGMLYCVLAAKREIR